MEGYAALVLKKTRTIDELENQLSKQKQENKGKNKPLAEFMRDVNDNREYEIKLKDLERENNRL